MKSIDLVAVVLLKEGPVHVLGVVLLTDLGEVHDGGLDSQLGIDDEGEDGLVLVVDSDIGCDVMS